jgi:hypothetical protein
MQISLPYGTSRGIKTLKIIYISSQNLRRQSKFLGLDIAIRSKLRSILLTNVRNFSSHSVRTPLCIVFFPLIVLRFSDNTARLSQGNILGVFADSVSSSAWKAMFRNVPFDLNSQHGLIVDQSY